MRKSLKFASALTAALMVAAPMALAPTASFAATTQHDGRYDAGKSFNGKQVAMYGKYRDGKAARGDHGVKHEKIVFRMHDKRFGHWGYSHGHRVWIVTFHAR